MSKNQLLALLKVNFLYVNPQYTTSSRKKKKTGNQIVKNVVLQYLLLSVFFVFVYGLSMFTVDFSQFPGYFTYYIALFSLMSFSQVFTSIFNIFFQSKDLASYQPLPFNLNQIFIAKFAVVAYTTLPFLLPILALFFLVGWQSNIFILINIIVSLIAFLGLFTLLFELCVICVFGITRSNFYKNNQKIVSSILMLIPTVLVVVAVLFLNFDTGTTSAEMVDRGIIPFIYPLYAVVTNPFSLSSVLILAAIVLLIAGLFRLISLWIVPSLYDITTVNHKKKRSTKKRKSHASLKEVLIHYNRGLINDPTLIMQSLSSTIIMPMVMIISGVVGAQGMLKLSNLSLDYAGVFFFTGIVFSLMTVNGASFVANLISLDRENFNFIRSLPISMKTYLSNKFWFGYLIQVGLNILVILLACIFLRPPVLLIICILAGNIIGAFFISQHYFYRDFRLLELQWTNVSQLFSRGGGNFALMFSIFGVLFGGIILIVVYAVTITMMGHLALAINLGVLAVLALIFGLLYIFYRNKFWQKLS
ncbi:ABC transporter [Vagococcus elongatus]|uniref:Uncharacterized protein n=1 Tax=Vagococcus elongatus TaxID=180344 RepID=A0A430B5A7_9ENTE|nr:ABC transporter [Vagococcus elongatus]RSU15546.1 hypothetical protein CBF29_00265 [Vagococcus elongatus]